MPSPFSIAMSKFEIDPQVVPQFYSKNNEIIKFIEKFYNVKISARGQTFKVLDAEKENEIVNLLEIIEVYILKKGKVTNDEIISLIRIKKDAPDISLDEILEVSSIVPYSRKPIYPKTLNQKLYVHHIQHNHVVFSIGPAGTGKTYLAMAVAIKYLVEKAINKIILTRPAVEAGESLGFLPGDLQAKIDPYLRPLYDALFDILPGDLANRFLERGQIEVAPLAYMRGRTLNDAFLILDEAQNSTSEQMKMFLTRIGFNSKAVITGDITQIDLPSRKRSGLVEAQRILKGINGIKFVFFNEKDVVRHEIVQKIIKAYQIYEEEQEKKKS
ncbi:phosphate starvation-inducible protein PhoH and related proteins [Thermotomaculum hydrothermale]|uniref:PhoH-like protein n=2 Tax=Thermotomaculum hydrothermale TaxID=981385 RepID=A0A7R6PES0_9BACT|nr:phosphate starvation-inducible protein PhoH and related proteins [Thermotomaculum hydrothermale]